jgi:dimethylargininase
MKRHSRPVAGLSWRFTHAIARPPAASIVNGLRAVDRGRPDLDTYLAEHTAYLEALQVCAVETVLLKPLEAYPDSVFVEDAALCLPEGFIVLRPGAPSRRGEADEMASEFDRLGYEFGRVDRGSIDGGDILVTDRVIMVGKSARTDGKGFSELETHLAAWGYAAELVETPSGVLHLKSDCAILDTDTVLATRRLAQSGCFEGFRVLEVPAGEEAAANCICVNDCVLAPGGYPATADLLDSAGYRVMTVPAGQAALLDGGLSCQSLRFRPAWRDLA